MQATVVCGDHRRRYPAAWRGCKHCPVSNQSVVNGYAHDSTAVEVC